MLEQAKPSVELAEAGEEVKKTARKPRKKPVAKKENKTEEAAPVAAEEKPADAE